MTASVTIFLESRSNVLAVPVKALKRERGRNVIYVLNNNGPHPVEIRTGWKDTQWVEVIGELEEGQTVVLELPADNL